MTTDEPSSLVTSWRRPIARTWGWSSHSAVDSAGEAGTSAASSTASHSSRGRAANTSSSTARIQALLAGERSLSVSPPTRSSSSTCPAPTAAKPRRMNAAVKAPKNSHRPSAQR